MKLNNIIARILSAVQVALKASVSFLYFLWNLVCDSNRRVWFLIRAWNQSRKELVSLLKEEQAAFDKTNKIKTNTEAEISAFDRKVALARTNAQAANDRLRQAIQDVSACLKGYKRLVQEAATGKASTELSEFRRQMEKAEEELSIVKIRCRGLMEDLGRQIDKVESEDLLPLETDAKELLHLLETWLKTPRMQQSKTISNIIDDWWKDNGAGFIETADELNSRLSQLPDELDSYTVQFKGDQKRLWLQPNGWAFDNENNLVLSRYNYGGVPFTVQGLRSLLAGVATDIYGNAVRGDMEVWLEHPKTANRYRPLDINFSISHKKGLVVIMMDDDGADDDYGDNCEDNDNSYDNDYIENGEDYEEDADGYEEDEGGENEYDDDEDGGNDDDGYDDADDAEDDYDDDDGDNDDEYAGNLDDNNDGGESGRNVEDDDGPEHDYDPSRSGSDIDQSFLETANDLFERLDELPKNCNRFTVRFVAANSDNWIQPEEWHIDDGDLIFECIDDGENHDDEELTVADLKDILTGGCEDDDGDTGIEEDTPVYVDDPDSGVCFRILDEYFKIRWKQGRVEIPMIEDCGDDNDEDDENSDDEENRCESDSDVDKEEDSDDYEEDEGGENEYDDDEDDEDDDDDDDDEDGDEDGDDDDDDDGDGDDEGDAFARRAAGGLLLGLMLENGCHGHEVDR